jgi:hypothetical protein
MTQTSAWLIMAAWFRVRGRSRTGRVQTGAQPKPACRSTCARIILGPCQCIKYEHLCMRMQQLQMLCVTRGDRKPCAADVYGSVLCSRPCRHSMSSTPPSWGWKQGAVSVRGALGPRALPCVAAQPGQWQRPCNQANLQQVVHSLACHAYFIWQHSTHDAYLHIIVGASHTSPRSVPPAALKDHARGSLHADF